MARFLAVGADALQLGFFPVFAEGFVSVLDIILDLVMCVACVGLLGFHVAFVPSFLFEMFPLLDLAPTWTIAVFIVTRKGPDAPPPIVGTEKQEMPVIDV
jgi:hypothetical protein